MKRDPLGSNRGPRPSLAVHDAVLLLVGIVIGVGVFKTPSVVATHVSTEWGFLALWGVGALISLMGALCYAELAASHPDVGGEYSFLRRAYGPSVAFLFAWGRLSVIQTGAIAAAAFVLGDYASELWPIEAYGSSIYAAVAVTSLTAINIYGLSQAKWLQNTLAIATVFCILVITGAGFLFAPEPKPPTRLPAPMDGAHQADQIGLAMIFILLTYGGWNEAAYLSAEVRNSHRNIPRVLVIGTTVVSATYLLLNLAYLRVLGLSGMRLSEAVAADLLRSTAGERGALIVSLIIIAATLTTVNATIFTGGRSSYALGRDFPRFRLLGRWNIRRRMPSRALFIQGIIALCLIGFGAITRQGFTAMVEYTAPVFWFFFMLTAFSLFLLRRREPRAERPFKVPLYPITPAVFCVACAYMLHASLAYTGMGALLGAAVLLIGIPLLIWSRSLKPKPRPKPKTVDQPPEARAG